MLEVRDLRKRFGGVVALDGVSLSVSAGEVHALIGPNGAGKTTLIGALAGNLSADAGSVAFEGRDMTRAAQHARVRAGLVRSFQITSVFRRFSVLENLALAVQARSGSSFSFWRPLAAERALFDEARGMAAEVDLAARLDSPAGTLSHGEQRALEVGVALATRPRMILLDEPMAGMGPQDSQRMIALIAAIRTRVAVLLVEHDMDAVFRLADRISVLVDGRVIASGPPREIRQDPQVRRAYLGEEVAAA